MCIMSAATTVLSLLRVCIRLQVFWCSVSSAPKKNESFLKGVSEKTNFFNLYKNQATWCDFTSVARIFCFSRVVDNVHYSTKSQTVQKTTFVSCHQSYVPWNVFSYRQLLNYVMLSLLCVLRRESPTAWIFLEQCFWKTILKSYKYGRLQLFWWKAAFPWLSTCLFDRELPLTMLTYLHPIWSCFEIRTWRTAWNDCGVLWLQFRNNPPGTGMRT